MIKTYAVNFGPNARFQRKSLENHTHAWAILRKKDGSMIGWDFADSAKEAKDDALATFYELKNAGWSEPVNEATARIVVREVIIV